MHPLTFLHDPSSPAAPDPRGGAAPAAAVLRALARAFPSMTKSIHESFEVRACCYILK
ncbi:hypothetical protein BGLA2_1140016 [Burkholderia gladioli]|nr:hypothetical protein BGLA2_1140016 [Burkholderia gladioli]